MMQQSFEKTQPFEKYFGDKYNYTPYINEIAVILPPSQTLILCNLLNKLYFLNKEGKIHKRYGKGYHFIYDQKSIFENELGMKKTAFRDNLKQLSKYVWYDGNRKKENEKGCNTTYFKLNLDAIKELFNEGIKKLGKYKKTPEIENKPQIKQPQQNNNNFAKGTNKKYPEFIIKGLNTINKTYNEYLNNKISEREYKNVTNPIKGLIEQNKFKITENKELKRWELK